MATVSSSLLPGGTERLLIARVGHRGDGVVETAHGPIYVPGTLPGEIAEVEPVAGSSGRRRLLRIERVSPQRIAPICPHFGMCGGCAVQHWEEQRYRAWKRDLVAIALARARLDAQLDDLVDAHGEGRRRAVLHARCGAHGKLEVGFAAARAHRVVPIDHCPILAPALARAIDVAWALARACQSTKPLDVQLTASDDGLDVDLRGSGPLPPLVSSKLADVARTNRLARLTRHRELIAQFAAPRVRMGRAVVMLPPAAFLQATAEGEAAIARLVAGHVGKAEAVADLFAGVGAFALRLAERARITAIDIDEAAIMALGRAAAATPGLKPVVAEPRDLLRKPYSRHELRRFDAVVFDPPRQAAEAQARELAAAPVPVIVAVSCNPATFVRDVGILAGGGYRLAAVTPVDQFRYSAHVEIVARLER
jgi:23S rRNA (uracil1939-C5)-methyltransferase